MKNIQFLNLILGTHVGTKQLRNVNSYQLMFLSQKWLMYVSPKKKRFVNNIGHVLMKVGPKIKTQIFVIMKFIKIQVIFPRNC